MKTHQIIKDDLVLIQTIEGQLLLKCWPNSAVHPSCASFQSSFFQRYIGSPLAVQRFQGSVSAVAEIHLYPEEYKNFMDSFHFQSFLEKELCDVYVTNDLTIHISYMGYPSYFTIRKIIPNLSCDTNIVPGELVSEHKTNRQMEEICCKLKEMVLDDSLREKNLSSSIFSQDVQTFQTSTPISSRNSKKATSKVIQQSAERCENDQEMLSNQQFHYLHPNTKVVVRNDTYLSAHICFNDIAGLNEQIEEVKNSVSSLLRPGYELIKVFSKGLLVVGSSGTGKSMIGEALKQEFAIPVYIFKHLDIKSSEDKNVKLKKIFKDADICSPSIIFLDDFDKLFIKDKIINSVQKEEDLQRNICSLIYSALNYSTSILVIAAVQNKNLLPIQLRKNGFFLKELDLSISSPAQRKQILNKILEKYSHQITEEEINEIARITKDFTFGELQNLCEKAKKLDLESGKNGYIITFHNLREIVEHIKPAAAFELDFEAPNVKWSDVGGMKKIKNTITEMVDWPLRLSHQFSKFKITPSRGILMYGPPGCCKTMIAKALVTESKFNFISVKGSELFNKYVGESEKSVSKLFNRARSSELPCVLFFDELDSISSIRGSTSGNSDVSNRVLTQLLVEIDGINVLKGVCILAATNRPDIIDPSFLRPGRFDHMVYVPLPDFETRQDIFKVKMQKLPVSSDVDLSYLARVTEGYSGAEIAEVCREAAKCAIKEDPRSTHSVITMVHFIKALKAVLPKTTEEMKMFYEKYVQ